MKTFNLFLLFFFFCVFTTSAQLSITGYSTFAIGAETKLYKKFSGEFRVFTNDVLEDVNAEVQFFYGFRPREYHQLKVGFGINGGLFSLEGNAFQIPIQLVIFPLRDLKRLAFVIEVTPQFLEPESPTPDQIVLRNLWGVRYTFGGE